MKSMVKMFCLQFLFCFVCGTVLADDLRNELEILKQEVKALKDARQTYNDRLSELENEIMKFKLGREPDFEMVSKLVNKRQNNKAFPIAFSARLSHDMGYLQDDQILCFDQVITNQGNHYDRRSGVFHCDEAGLYVFQLSVVAVPGAYVTAQIAKNHQGQAWAFSMDPTNSSSGGTMVVLYLQPGDAVYARVNGNGHDRSYRSITKQYTSFSGFLIR